ncbi:hypothetical protein JVU11DRAFT_2618 [Chiua virens]|nr:hypothetical protein JVU11DRAFT_2618 [Chiua virens]
MLKPSIFLVRLGSEWLDRISESANTSGLMIGALRAIRKKRSSDTVTASNPAPEGDHRKRRRNRTTQSCLNCHTSKRMCDRKRPCGRCTQLGLTGLCVYEVDDPSQRTDIQDESSRLRKRVAELEGVIRELKNKPHPRWAKSGSSPGEEFEKCHARSRSMSTSEDSVLDAQRQSEPLPLPLPLPPTTTSIANANEEPLDKQSASSLLEETFQPDYLSSSFTPPLSTLSYSPYFDISSPPSAPSTGIVTPTDEHPQVQIVVAGDQPSLTNDIDLASLFMSYPDLLGCDESSGHVDRAAPDQYPPPATSGSPFDEI